MKQTQTRPPTANDRRRARRVILKSLQAIPEYKLLRQATTVWFARSPKHAYELVLSYMEKGAVVATTFEAARNYPTGIPFGGWPFTLDKHGNVPWSSPDRKAAAPLVKTVPTDWRIWREAQAVSYQTVYHKLWAEYEKVKPWERTVAFGSHNETTELRIFREKRLRTAEMKRLHRRIGRLAPQVTRIAEVSPDPEIWDGMMATVDGRLIVVWEKPLVFLATGTTQPDRWRGPQIRLHSETGPAVQYRDGFSVWAIEGVVSRELAVEKVTPAIVMRQTNQEVRRTLMERMGGGLAFLKAAGATMLDESKDSLGLPRRLWKIHRKGRIRVWGDEREWSFLEVTNSTPEPDGHHKTYILRVPPITATAEEGQAWLAGMDANQYKPLRET